MIYTVKAFRAKKVVSNRFALLHTIFYRPFHAHTCAKHLEVQKIAHANQTFDFYYIIDMLLLKSCYHILMLLLNRWLLLIINLKLHL